MLPLLVLFFFFNDTATTEIYTLSLHDALPICLPSWELFELQDKPYRDEVLPPAVKADRKSTRLNSSHQIISYAVFCLKKKNSLSHHTRPATRSHAMLYAAMSVSHARCTPLARR